jgi:predicted short-subunit dehydrogenase-like oxidoreductase (DUF2520 family)
MIPEQAIIIGKGRLGQTLHSMLSYIGVNSTLFRSRHIQGKEIEGLKSGLIFLTSRDDKLEELASTCSMARSNWEGVTVFHCSGGLEVRVLDGFLEKGAEVGVIHPCYTIFKPMEHLPKNGVVCYTVQATNGAIEVARELIDKWAGRFILLGDVNRSVYHAGAVMAVGHVITLLCAAEELLIKSGLSKEEALFLVKSLHSGVASNVFSLDNEGSIESLITGPFVRRDIELIKKQKEAISNSAPQFLQLYELLGLLSQSFHKAA